MSPLQCPGLHSVKLPALTSHIPFRPFHSECMFIGPKAKVCFPFLDFSNIRFPFTLQKGGEITSVQPGLQLVLSSVLSLSSPCEGKQQAAWWITTEYWGSPKHPPRMTSRRRKCHAFQYLHFIKVCPHVRPNFLFILKL